jgi:methyltransferase (TIGR00027 family)
VIYGAGFDSRAVRFLNPDSDIRVFEIDTALTLDAKAKQFNKRKVTKPEDNIYIPVDFNKEKIRPKLLSSQFNIHKKSLSVLEGIIMYLSHDAVDETFRLISDYSAPGSLLVFDYIYSSVLRRENKYFGESSIYNRVMKDNEEWTFGIEEGEIENFLNRYRFNLMEHLDSNIIENKYFRNDSGQVITKVNGTHCIVLASKPD